ncbi:response regulator [Mongoliimonas terrestris]|uniref:response regulator n=1 Tax=Mongoliimonas terrestris TaxID=1709001 RepID=UPI00094980DC|nr:response regulator transcription factor [Mongoliimonas terrestris]
MNDPIRVLVADDHPLFRGAVANSLVEAGGVEVVAECGDADSAVSAAGDHLPHVALIDISMPGDGLTAVARIATDYPAVRIVMLTASEQDDDLMRALQAGACGYVLKGVTADALAEIVRMVRSGGSYISPEFAGRVLTTIGAGKVKTAGTPDPVSDLTARELQILRLVARGASNREVGDDLGLREATVKFYMTNILQKLQVRNRVEAALIARERGV